MLDLGSVHSRSGPLRLVCTVGLLAGLLALSSLPASAVVGYVVSVSQMCGPSGTGWDVTYEFDHLNCTTPCRTTCIPLVHTDQVPDEVASGCAQGGICGFVVSTTNTNVTVNLTPSPGVPRCTLPGGSGKYNLPGCRVAVEYLTCYYTTSGGWCINCGIEACIVDGLAGGILHFPLTSYDNMALWGGIWLCS